MTAMMFHANSAHADHEPEIIAGVIDVGIVLPGLALSMPNVVHVARGKQPPIGWPIVGFVLGGTAAGFSALVLADLQPGDSPTLAIVGLAGGGLEIGLALWALLQPEEQVPSTTGRFTLTPVVMRGVAGRPAYGLTVTAAGF
jgi:hypothetical protein